MDKYKSLKTAIAEVRSFFLAGFFVVFLIPGAVSASDQNPLEPLSTSSPGSTLYGFLAAVDDAVRTGTSVTWENPTFRDYLRQQSLVNEAM